MKSENSVERQREKYLFNIFQEQYQTFDDFKHADVPDFLVFNDSETLGIEFTEVYKQSIRNGKTPREDEAIKERILNNAKRMCIKKNTPPLHVGVSFTKSIVKKREKVVTEELFKIVKNNCPAEHGTVTVDNNFDGDMPNEFYSIIISNITGAKRHFWDSVEASFVDTNFSDQLQNRIDRKTERLSEYLKKCDRCWLVIVALGNNGSSFYEYSMEMEKSSYESPFEKVFFMEAFTKDLRELNCN